MNPNKERTCRVCGCTESHGCPGGCYWVEKDLCSLCEAISAAEWAIVGAKDGEFIRFKRTLFQTLMTGFKATARALRGVAAERDDQKKRADEWRTIAAEFQAQHSKGELPSVVALQTDLKNAERALCYQLQRADAAEADMRKMFAIAYRFAGNAICPFCKNCGRCRGCELDAQWRGPEPGGKEKPL